MAKPGFVASILLIAFGMTMLSIGLLTQVLIPKIGYFIFQLKGGSYMPDSYGLGAAIWVHHLVALACIVFGGILSLRLSKDLEQKHDSNS